MTGHLAQDPVLPEERHDDELGEEPLLQPVDEPVRRGAPTAGSPNSIAHISPSPRTSRTTS